EDIALFRSGADPYGHPDINWFETLFRKTAPMSSSGLSLDGGTEKVRYFVSMGFDTQSGLLRDFTAEELNNQYYFNRYSFRSNLDIKATNSLSLRLDMAGNTSVTNQPRIRDL